MRIEVVNADVRLQPQDSLALVRSLREGLSRLSHRVVRVLVRLREGGRGKSLDCAVTVELDDGQQVTVQERQRRLGVLVRRVAQRAWRATAARLLERASTRPVLRLRAPTLRRC